MAENILMLFRLQITHQQKTTNQYSQCSEYSNPKLTTKTWPRLKL